MHELSIISNLLEAIEVEKRRRGFHRVVEIVLEVGVFSCLEPDALQVCFRAGRRGTAAEGARLTIQRAEGRGRCEECNSEFTLQDFFHPCPNCGNFKIEILSGNQVKIKYLEVE